MPEKRSAFNYAFVDTQLGALAVPMHKLSPEIKYAAHVSRVLLVLVLEHTLVFLAEVPEVMKPHEFLGSLSHQPDVQVLSEEKVVVLSKDA